MKTEKFEPFDSESLTDEGRRVWLIIEPEFAGRDLRRSDGLAIARYCELYAAWETCLSHISQHGSTYPVRGVRTDADGKQEVFVKRAAEFPQVRQARALERSLLALEKRLGLSEDAKEPRKLSDQTSRTGPRSAFLDALRDQ